MATISATTKHKIGGAAKKVIPKGKKSGKTAKRGSIAPPLKPTTLTAPSAIDELKGLEQEQQITRISELVQKAFGVQTFVDKSKPHAASTTRDRSGAAADVATAANALGVPFVLKKCKVTESIQQMLFPEGISSIFTDEDTSGLKPSASALSLASLADATASTVDSATIGTDSKRGKLTPADAREGALLLIRAFCEIVGKPAEPYVVGAFLAAALDECGSNSSSVREAAEDAATAMIRLANPWAFPCLISPLIIKSLKSTEWRVKSNSLDRLAQCAETAPNQVCKLLPKLIPAVTSQVWDTKAQVTKAAGSALLAICKTNANPDIQPAIPAVVNAICKPSETNKAIEKLMGTTFVVTVDASSLSILCPVLSRALKEKLAIHKRAACLVISNMSKLVGSPEDVAPFGPLLVPELKKVASSVQFEEIRDEALKALNTLTKALGDMYKEDEEKQEKQAAQMAEETRKVEEEQKRIEAERQVAFQKEEEFRKKEEEEKRRFKEAMDAQRELTKIEAEKARKQAEDDARAQDKAKRSTKGTTGKCQGCGLKKCKKTCLFFGK